MSYHYYPYHHSAEKHKLVYDVSHIKIIAAFNSIKAFKIKYHQFVEPISDIVPSN